MADTKIPKDAGEWRELMQEFSLGSDTIYNYTHSFDPASNFFLQPDPPDLFDPAANFTIREFLLLRAVYPLGDQGSHDQLYEQREQWFNKRGLDIAEGTISTNPRWTEYINCSFFDGVILRPSQIGAGSFGLVVYLHQEAIEKKEVIYGEKRVDPDFYEKGMFMTFQVFLLSLLLLSPEATVDVRPSGYMMTMSDGKKAVYQTRTSIDLLSRSGGVKAIVTARSRLRAAERSRFRMQETAQVAAWISSHPPDAAKMRREGKKKRRLHASQYLTEIYLTIAEFDADYVDYVCGRQSDSVQSFLSMYDYGPFDTTIAAHMNELGHLLIAFMIDGSLKKVEASP